MAEEPKLGFHHDAVGTHAMGRKENGHTVGVVLVDDTSDPRANQPCAMSATRSSGFTGPISGSTVPPRSPGLPT